MTSMTPGRRATCARPRRTTAAERPDRLLDIEVIGGALSRERVLEAVAYAAASGGGEGGRVARGFVRAERIAELTQAWRDKVGPTDVLSFPVDEDYKAP